MSEMEVKTIKTKIEQIKKEMAEVKGTPCQVYSRVVGYLRPVQSWNNGKIEEYRGRKFYNVGNGEKEKDEANMAHDHTMAQMTHIKCFRQCK